MIADGEPPMPAPGGALRSVGVRVHGTVIAANDSAPDGVVELRGVAASGSTASAYALTGVASDSRDVAVGDAPATRGWRRLFGRRQDRFRHSHAEFVLTVGAQRFHVSFNGRATDVSPGTRVTVTGDLELLGEYEWEGFDYVDTRADWMVADVVPLRDGDVMVDLVQAPDGGSLK